MMECGNYQITTSVALIHPLKYQWVLKLVHKSLMRHVIASTHLHSKYLLISKRSASLQGKGLAVITLADDRGR